MKWSLGSLVVVFVSWVMLRAFVPALLLFSLGVALLIGYLYHDVLPLMAVAGMGLLWFSRKGRSRG